MHADKKTFCEDLTMANPVCIVYFQKSKYIGTYESSLFIWV